MKNQRKPCFHMIYVLITYNKCYRLCYCRVKICILLLCKWSYIDSHQIIIPFFINSSYICMYLQYVHGVITLQIFFFSFLLKILFQFNGSVFTFSVLDDLHFYVSHVDLFRNNIRTSEFYFYPLFITFVIFFKPKE